MAAEFCFLNVWRLSWQFDDLNEINLLSSKASTFCVTESCPPSVNTSEFTGSWIAALTQGWAWPKKPSWEMASEQNCTLPCSEQTHASPPYTTQWNFCQPYCKYQLELAFPGFLVSGDRAPIDPDFKGFLTNIPWSNTSCIFLAFILQRIFNYNYY